MTGDVIAALLAGIWVTLVFISYNVAATAHILRDIRKQGDDVRSVR